MGKADAGTYTTSTPSGNGVGVPALSPSVEAAYQQALADANTATATVTVNTSDPVKQALDVVKKYQAAVTADVKAASVPSSKFTYGGILQAKARLKADALSLADAYQKLNTAKQLADPGSTANLTPDGFKFNLPTHLWSLPLTPAKWDNDYLGPLSGTPSTSPKPVPNTPITGGASSVDHGARRAVIWYYDGATNESTYDASTGTVTTGSSIAAKTVTGANGSTAATTSVSLDYKYAFQFMWNPESIQTSVQRNMDITPSNADRFTTVQGMFPGMETVSVSIVLDRTNDFACFYNMPRSQWPSAGGTFYGPAWYSGAAFPDYDKQIYDLLHRGTVADIEYLLRAINGEGQTSASKWRNLLKQATPDIGYLQPTVLAVRFGPSTENSLSYVGWVQNLDIEHLAFNENMIPLRSTLNLSLSCFTGSQQA